MLHYQPDQNDASDNNDEMMYDDFDVTIPSRPISAASYRKPDDMSDTNIIRPHTLSDTAEIVAPSRTSLPPPSPLVQVVSSDSGDDSGYGIQPAQTRYVVDGSEYIQLTPDQVAQQRVSLQFIRIDSTPKAGPSPLLKRYYSQNVNIRSLLLQHWAHVPLLATVRRTDDINIIHFISQDQSVALMLEYDKHSNQFHIRLVSGGVLGQHYTIEHLSDMDRDYWYHMLDNDVDQSPPAFLWNHQRWEQDYMVSFVEHQQLHLFLYSPQKSEAAIRLSSNSSQLFLQWISTMWQL